MTHSPVRRVWVLASVAALLLAVAPAALAHPEDDGSQEEMHRHDPADDLETHDAVSEALEIISDGPTGKKIKNMAVAGHGERILRDATTDVWAHEHYAWIGTFNEPCGTGEGFVSGVGEVDLIDDVTAPGLPTFDVRNKNQPEYVGNIPSVEGSRINDVKVATMNSGDILVHTNEPCAGGPGGVEIYNVDDPLNPIHLGSIRIDEQNPLVEDLFGEIEDVGTHNLFLFTQGDRDFVAVVAETVFDNFQIWEITDPTDPVLVSDWGAEELFQEGAADSEDPAVIFDAAVYLLQGPGTSQNRFLHDITINEEGTLAYLSNWDAGLVLLDISDVDNPQFVSQAINLEEGSLDGELNSHAAWPSEDGSIVVETEEDFDAWEPLTPPGNLTFGDEDPDAPLPGVAISTLAGDEFEANPTGNVGTLDASTLTVTEGPLAGETFAAIELSGDQPRLEDVGPITGEIVFIGRACDGDEILNADQLTEENTEIAVVRRGDCTFREKNFNAAAAGADAIVIANNLRESTPWGGVRIWDYSDPDNPVLASTFYTECAAADEPIEGCDPAGTYSVHNVIVETHGNRVLAYISWYWDGMVVLDVTDPYNPVEIARFDQPSETGLPHDFWGVYKVENQPFVYGSDRNNGLYIFKLLGKGTMQQSEQGQGQGSGKGR